MSRFFIKKRFTNENVSEKLANIISPLVGPFQNFSTIKTVQYLNLRIISSEKNSRKLQMVNNYRSVYKYEINEFIKAFLCSYSDCALTNQQYLYKKDFNIDYSMFIVSHLNLLKLRILNNL